MRSEHDDGWVEDMSGGILSVIFLVVLVALIYLAFWLIGD